MKSFVKVLLSFELVFCAATFADPYPPTYSNGAGVAIHFDPVAWPTEPADPRNCGSSCGQWKPYTRFQNDLADPRVNDPSNGGTSPQGLVNVTSSCTDKALPSIYYYLRQGATPADDVLMFRWRVEQAAHNYATGPSAGNYGSSNPWSSALWTVLFDVNGSGYRSLAAHLNGSSGAPATAIDLLVGVWGENNAQSLDYTDPYVHQIAHNPTAFVGPTSKLLNFHGSVAPDENWPNGASETDWDYGTTRARLVSQNSCTEYFIDYQIPVAMLDATGIGGPSITRETPIAMMFCTANSLNNPFQKDCAVNKSWAADASKPAPFGDYLSFNQTEPYSQPIVSAVSATAPASCPGSYALKATVQDTLALQSGSVVTSVKAVDFYYWYDRDGDGEATNTDTGSAWTKITPTATLKSGTLNTWQASWNATGLSKGKYLIGVQAADDNTKIDDGMTASGVDNRTFSYLTGNASNQIYIDGAWIGTQQSIFPTHSPSQAPGATENWYGNPDVTGSQIAVIGTAINACGIAPTMTLAVSSDNVIAGDTFNYTITIANPSGNATSVSIDSISDTLPAGFSYVASSSIGTGGFSSTDPGTSGQVLTWTYGSPVSLAPGASATLTFTVTASSTSGVYNDTATAQSSFGELSAGPVSVAVDSARLSLTSTPDSFSVAADGSDQITFTLTYANDSAVAVTGGSITTTLPAGVTYVSCTGGNSCNNSSGVVTWNVGAIAGEASGSVSYTVTVPNTWSTTSLTTSATLAATAPDSSPTSTSASSTVAVTGVTIPGTPSFSLTKTASAVRVAPGGSITYTLNYQNYGTASASSVVITDVLPAGITYSSCTGSCSNSSGTITWNIGTVAANGSGSVTVTAAAANPFTYPNPAENTASIDWSGGTTVQATNSVGVSGNYCSAVFYFHQGANNNIATVRPASETAPTGSTDYTTTLSNISDNTFGTYLTETNQVVFEQSAGLGSALDISNQTLTISYYLSAAQGGGRAQVILRNDTTNTTIATSAEQNISTGSTALYTFTATVPASTSIGANDKLRWYFQFRASGGKDITFHYDNTSYNSRSSFCSATSPADMSVGVTVDDSSITAGSTQLLTYTIQYANNGGSSATNTVLTNTLPSSFTNCQYSTNNSTWSSCSSSGSNPPFHAFSLGTITSGSSGTVYVRGNAPAGSTASSTLTNTAAIVSDQTSTVSATAKTDVVSAGAGGTGAALVVNLAANNTSIVPGDTVTYTVTVVNTGDASAASVQVVNALPASTYYTYGSCSGGCVNASNTLTWSVGALAAGASQSYTYTMTAGTTGLAAGITVINDDADATATGISETSNAVAVALSGNPQLAVTNTATPDNGLRPADTISYSLVITNNGSATASDVVVSNPIPTYTSYKGSITASAGSGSFDTIGNRVIFSVGSLAAGASATLSFQVTVNPLDSGTTTITSTATASASNAAQQSAVETATATAAATLDVTHSISGSAAYPSATLTSAASGTTLYVNRTDRLQVNQLISVNSTVARIVSLSSNSIVVNSSITASSGASVIGALTLNIAYQNTGDAAASSVVLTDSIPNGLGYYASSTTPDTTPTSGSHGDVVWNIGTLAVGASDSRQIYVFPTGTTGTLTSNVLIEASNAVDDNASASIAIGGITVTKSTSTATLSAGDQATYTITLTNSLASPVSNVTVTDTLASGFTYRTGSATVGGNAIEPTFAGSDTDHVQPIWSALTVPASGTLVIVFNADIDAAAGADDYQNEVSVDVPAGIGLLPFDALLTTAEDVSVLASNTGVLKGYVFERVSGTTNLFETGNDLPLAGVRVEIYQTGADCSDPYSATCYVVYTDSNGYFEKTAAAQGWFVKVVAGTGDLGALWTQTVGSNDTVVTVPDQGEIEDHNGFIQTQSFTVTATAGSGGSVSPGSQSILNGSTTTVTVTPSTGYSIDTVTGCSGSLSGGTYTTGAITANCAVSASFSLNSYSVTFDLNGGTRTGGGALSQTVSYGGTATAPTLTAPLGYTFSSWDVAFSSITGNLTVTAQYTLINYTVTPSAGTGGSISPATAQTVAYGNTTSFSITASSGYAIASVSGCGGSLSGTTYTTGTINGNCSVTATFSVGDHTVTPSAGSGGSISPSTPQAVADGNTTSFTVTPATGYSISSVSGCGGSLSGTTYTTAAVTTDCSVSASFGLNSYAVTFDLDGGTRTGGGALSQTVSHGGAATAPTLTAPAGHTFSSWDVTFSSITSNLTVTAQYTTNNYIVTPSADTGGSISPATAQTVAYGNTTSFTVTASSGYAIAGVSGCGGSLSGATYTTGAITGNCSVAATFSIGDHTVTPSAGTGGSISPSTPQAVADGNTTSFTVIPDTGYSINSVSGCGGSLSGTTYTTAAVTASCSVSASFSTASFTVTFDLDGGTRTGGGALSQSVNYGGAATAPILTPPAGNTFSGWDVAFNNITGNLTVTAQYSPNNYTVTPSAGAGGSISPATAQTVAHGSTTSFTVTADSGYAIASVSGCGGTLSGATYTTGAITSNCSVTATFSLGGHTVTPSAGSGGSLSPATPQTVANGNTTSFTVTADTGYSVGTVTGCGGTLAGTTYTTAAITTDCSVSAVFTLNSYTVTFDLDGGTRTGGGALSQSVNYGSAATAPTLTPPAGHTFSSWDVAFNNITGNLTVTAQYSANNYTVTPSAGSGGSISPATAQTVAYGNTTSFTINASSGYAIASVSGCSGSLIGTTYTTSAVTGNCSVTATFSFGGHTVTPSAGSGGSISPSTPQTVADGNTTSFVITPDAGYSISSVSGCGGSLSGGIYSTAAVTANCSVSAAFTLNSYTVTFDLNGGTRTGGGTLTQSVNYGGGATAPTLTPPAGHVFNNWDVAFNNITGNLTVTAQYTANNYTVTPTVGSGGSISPNTPQTVAYGNTTSFTIAADSGYAISSVTGCAGSLIGTTYTTGTITSNCAVTVAFVFGGHSVTPSAGSGGSISPSTIQTVANGNTTSFVVTPDIGHGISSVTGCGGSLSGSVYTTAAVTAPCSVSAAFSLNTYTVTFDLNGGTRSGGGTLTQTVSHGSAASAPVLTPPAGKVFSSWDVAFNNITGNLTVTAQYNDTTHTVSLSIGSGGSASPSTAQTVSNGNTTSFTITPDAGYTVASSSGCGGSLSSGIYTTGAIAADCTVSIAFSQNNYTVTPTAGNGGSISPATPQTVAHGNTIAFTVTPNSGYHISGVNGCTGSLSGNTFTTGTITANCSISATFTQITFAVTPTAGVGGTITPSTVQTVALGATTHFSIAANTGYAIGSITGCGGTRSANTYDTGAITANCSVNVIFTALPDDDFDGILDTIEGTLDSDGDNVLNYLDRDSDSDGIPDAIERGHHGDPDVAPIDTDGDGTRDYLDLDSDNDGIGDFIEGGGIGIDTDGDNIDDHFDVDNTGGDDNNDDGVDDAVTAADTDHDGVPDYQDLDSDNDSATDVDEAGLPDTDRNGLVDDHSRTNIPRDSDNDGVADFRDIDSDNDGLNDIVENGSDVLDRNSDGRIDDVVDSDRDGIPDIFDVLPLNRGTTAATENDDDNIPAVIDKDDDGDGIPDAEEGNGDSDDDGVPDSRDRDSDNDGIPDTVEIGWPAPSGVDSDQDGLDDTYDVDATGGVDGNGDGVDDRFSIPDSDGDGIPNYRDDDSDNDGLPDVYEQLKVALSGIDSDSDGIDDAVDVDSTGGSDANGDGIDDELIRAEDMDRDGKPDYLDTDSDGDNIDDNIEDGDYNEDGINDRLQKDPGLRAALRGNGGGGGALGVTSFILLGLLAGKRRRAWLLAAIASTAAAAADQPNGCQPDNKPDIGNSSCWYAGAGLGQSTLKPDDGTSGWKIDDDTDNAWQVTLGYHLYSRWFVEARWADLGTVTLKNRNPLITDSVSVDYSAPSLWGGAWLMPQNSHWNLFAKVGYAKLYTHGNDIDVEHMEGAQLAFGAGAQWRFNSHWYSQIEYVGYDKDAHYAGISLNRYFGTATQEREPTKVVTNVEPAPSVEPDAVREPVKPPVPRELCKLFDGKPVDVNFETGSATLTPHAKDVLHASVAPLQANEKLGVEIHAHTDGQGSAAFNQTLSQKRAEAVSAFLMAAGISSDRLKAIGHGENQPVADNTTDSGRAQNRRVELKPIGEIDCNPDK